MNIKKTLKFFILFLLSLIPLVATAPLHQGVDITTGKLSKKFSHLNPLAFKDQNGKVLKIFSNKNPIKPITSFAYEDKKTIVRDLAGKKTCYHHDGKQVYRILTYDKRGTLYREEILEWNLDGENLDAYSLKKGDGSLFMQRRVQYNQNKQIIHESFEGSSINGIYGIAYDYDEETDALILKEDSDGNRTQYLYHPKQEKISGIISLFNDGSSTRRFLKYDNKMHLTSVKIDDGFSSIETDGSGITFQKTLVFSPSIQSPEAVTIHAFNLETGENECINTLKPPYFDTENFPLLNEFLNFESPNEICKTWSPIAIASPHRYSESGYIWNDLGQVITIANSCGNKIDLIYDSLGRVIKAKYPAIEDSNGKVIKPTYHLKYDIANRLVAIIDPNDHTTKFTYSPHHKPSKIIFADGSEIHPSPYTPFPLSPPSTEPDIPVELATLDYQFTKETNGLDQIVWKLSAVDKQGNQTNILYNSHGFPATTQKINAAGELTQELCSFFDGCGNKTQEIYSFPSDPYQEQACYIKEWSYGPKNKIQRVSEALGTKECQDTIYYYNEKGGLETIVKPDSTSIHYIYDSKNRLNLVYASDHSIYYELAYNQQNKLTEIYDLKNHLIHFRTYNQIEQLIKEEFSNGLTIETAYQNGHKSSITLPDQSSIRYVYNGDLKVERYDPEGNLLYNQLSMKSLDTVPMIKNLGFISKKYTAQGFPYAIDTPYWKQKVSSSYYYSPQKTYEVETFDKGELSTFTYSFDEENRLTYESTFKEKEYDYDLFSNLYTPNGDRRKYSPSGQLLINGNRSHLYDKNGNLIRLITPSTTFEYCYDALNRLSKVIINDTQCFIYYYDFFNRRIAKTEFKKHAKSWHLVNEERFLHDGKDEIAKFDEANHMTLLRVLSPNDNLHIAIEKEGHIYAPIPDLQNNISCLVDTETKEIAEYYRYSGFGEEQVFNQDNEVIRPSDSICPWRFAGRYKDSETGFICFGERYFDPRAIRWISKELLSIDHLLNPYNRTDVNPLSLLDPDENRSYSSIWYRGYHYFQNMFQQAYQWKKSASSYIEENLSIEPCIRPALEPLGITLLGKNNLILFGFYNDSTQMGIIGNGELDPKVRVTFINGMLNDLSRARENAEFFSSTHGDINVHYIYRPSLGWTQDLIKSFTVQHGYMSPEARLLAKTWKSLIEEMGGAARGGIILHYAHSIGGAETINAKTLLTPQEQKMIRVITLGSPVLVQQNGFYDSINYISVRDFVHLLYPLSHLNAHFWGGSKVVYLGDLWGIPIIDHTTGSPTYKAQIEKLGKEFVDYFIEKKRKNNTFSRLVERDGSK